MDYEEALRRIFSLTDYERTAAAPSARRRYDLTRIRELLRRLGDPHLRVPTVHVTGTKGKGSTAAMIASGLRHGGFHVGLYTSPHLHTIRERIQTDGSPVSEALFARTVERLWPAVEEMGPPESDARPSFFELLTAMAFFLFADEGMDWQVLEVGMGGTLDATNVIAAPAVCVLTSISLDHTGVLGDTVEEIARDKAGIIKEGAVAVTAPQTPGVLHAIREACEARGVPLVEVGEAYRPTRQSWDVRGQWFVIDGPRGERRLWVPLLGDHQLENAACALAALDAIGAAGTPLPAAGVAKGFRNVAWPGRLEVLRASPLIVVDGAHNPYSMRRMVEAVRYHFPRGRCILLFGCTRGHAVEAMVLGAARLQPVEVLATESRHPRSVPARELIAAFQEASLEAQPVGSVGEAVDRALGMAGPEDLVLATGSLFTVAEVRESVIGISPERYDALWGPNAL